MISPKVPSLKSIKTCLFLMCFKSLLAMAAPPVEQEWTMLLFLNGHNTLDQYGSLNINQLEEVGSTDKINLVVQWASLKQNTKRLLIKKDGDISNVTSPVLEEIAPLDMGDPNELVKFAKWGMKKFPAKKYFLIVWNHGSGWHYSNRVVNNGISPMDISYDDKSGNVISTEQLGKALREIAEFDRKPIELFGADACLMSMAEVLGELRGSVKYFAGSQELEPVEGWPYADLLKLWSLKPDLGGGELARLLTDEYVKAYSPGGSYKPHDVTFSAFDMTKQTSFERSVQKLVLELNKLSDQEMKNLGPSIAKSQRFGYLDYLDLIDMLNLMQKEKPELKDPIEKVSEELKKFAYISRVTDRYKTTTHGMSIWMPDSSNFGIYADRYSRLNFNMNTGWIDFLKRISDLRVIGLRNKIHNQLLAPLMTPLVDLNLDGRKYSNWSPLTNDQKTIKKLSESSEKGIRKSQKRKF